MLLRLCGHPPTTPPRPLGSLRAPPPAPERSRSPRLTPLFDRTVVPSSDDCCCRCCVRAMDSTADADLPSWSAPGDATFPSLVLGIVLGLAFAFASLLALTHSAAQWAAIAARLSSHAPSIGSALAAAVAVTLFVQLGCRKWRQHAAIKAEERLAALKRNIAHLPARFPNGWYKLCDSRDLPLGATKHVTLLSKETAIFRGLGDAQQEAGTVFCVDAVCPHLGANLGRGGKVVENKIECPFHGWQFEGATGKCGHIPYAKKIPVNAKVPTWDLYEINGSIFLHYDVDHAQPSWFIPSLAGSDSSIPASSFSSPLSLRQQRSGWSGRFHGLIRADVPGNIQELVAKNADSWSEDLIRVAPAAGSDADAAPKTKSARVWGCVDLQWGASKQSWSVSSDAPCATLLTTARLTLLGLPLPFLSFGVILLHVGPSLLYLTFRPQSLLLRWIIGEIVLLQATRPDSAFINSVEITASTRRDTSMQSGLLSLAYTFALPLQRLLSIVLLRLLFARFSAACLPIYSLGRVRPLSLHNSTDDGGGGGEHSAHADREADSASGSDEEESKRDKESAGAVQPSSPEKHAAAASASASSSSSAPRRVSRRTGYTSSSAFYSTFLQRFYSDSGHKKQDDMAW